MVGEGTLVAMIEPADGAAAAPATTPSSTGATPPADTAQVATASAQLRPSETADRVEPVATSGEPDRLTQREIATHCLGRGLAAARRRPGERVARAPRPSASLAAR